MSLFRQDVYRQQKAITGRIILTTPKGLYGLVWFGVTVFFVLIVWLLWQDLDERIEVNGTLIRSIRASEIHAPISGSIKKWHVTPGQLVRKGAPIVTVQSNQSLVETSQRDAQLTYVQNQITIEQSRHKEIISQHNAQLSALMHELATIERNTKQERLKYKQLLQIAQKYYQLWQSALTHQATSISKQQILTLESQYQNAHFAAEHSQLTLLNLAQEANQLNLQKQALGSQMSLADMEHETLIASYKLELKQISEQQEYTLIAESTGLIDDIILSDNIQIIQGQTLVEIIPQTSSYDVELYLNPKHYAQVFVEQDIQLSFVGFPIQHYGSHAAVISQLGTTLNVSKNNPHFTAQAKLIEQPRHKIKHGMPVTAKVRKKTRKVYEWLIEPVLVQWKMQGDGHV